MMKFKSLFRRKASPTGNERNSALSPSASSISHSSSSSSFTTQSASSPTPPGNDGEPSRITTSSTPIMVGARFRSSTDPHDLSPRTAAPPLPARSDFVVYHDEELSHSHSPVMEEAQEVSVLSFDVAKNDETIKETAIMRDSPDHFTTQWEQQSRQSSGSEVSLACLQGRIQQMEETHHSTNEELQATLQELADLQVQLTELQCENDRLREENSVVLKRLEQKNQQIQQSKDQVEALKQCLVLERKGAEEAHKSSIEKQTKLNEMLSSQQAEATMREQHIAWLQDQIRRLEACSTEGNSKLQADLNKATKENDKLRQEKEAVELSLSTIQDQMIQSQKETNALKDQLTALQDELRNTKQKAKEDVADLEYKVEQLLTKKQSLVVETGTLHAAIAELETACRRHLEDKREMRVAAADQQAKLVEAMTKKDDLEKILNEERSKWEIQQEEWQQYQKDLLTTVRVANDFKLETTLQMEKVSDENRRLKEEIAELQIELSRMKNATAIAVKPRVQRSLSSLDSTSNASESKPRAIATRVDNRSSVKRIIENLEESSVRHKPSEETAPVATVRPDTETLRPLTLMRTESDSVFIRTPSTRSESRISLPSQPYSTYDSPKIKPVETASAEQVTPTTDRKDPLAGLVKNGGSKRNALLKWCQTRTAGYANIDITNFSSSWNDGLALCALLHTYLPAEIPFQSLSSSDVRQNFQVAFKAAESVGIPTTLNIEELISSDRPDWLSIMTYITAIYKHFET